MKKTEMTFLRTDGFLSFTSSVMAILAGLLIGFFVLLLSNFSQSFDGFSAILIGGMANLKNVGQVLYYATPIIMTGLSVSFANKTGLFNIGGPGQFIVGACLAVIVGVKFTFLPSATHWIVALLAAMLGGALWGLITGALKALYNVNEVISCIIMNYIGMYSANYLISKTVLDVVRNQSQRVPASAVLPKMGFDSIFKNGTQVSSVNIGIIIALISCILIYIILQKTTFGYELKAVGYNKDCSKYAGINEKRSIMLSMSIAGSLAGLGGALLYLAGSGKSIEIIDVLAAEGFNGIPVALLGLNNPLGIFASGILVAYLKVGGEQMQLFNFAPEVIDIIISVIIYFSSFALLFKGVIKSLLDRGFSKQLRRKEE